jgi:hypothetical protein
VSAGLDVLAADAFSYLAYSSYTSFCSIIVISGLKDTPLKDPLLIAGSIVVAFNTIKGLRG